MRFYARLKADFSLRPDSYTKLNAAGSNACSELRPNPATRLQMADEARELRRHRIAVAVLVRVAQRGRFLDLAFNGAAVGRGEPRLEGFDQRHGRGDCIPALRAKLVDHLLRVAGGAWSCRKKQDQGGFECQLSAHVDHP